MMGTRGKRQKIPPPSFPKRKRIEPLMSPCSEPFIGCMELLFPKVFMSRFLAWPNGMTTAPKKEEGKNSSTPPPHPKEKDRTPNTVA